MIVVQCEGCKRYLIEGQWRFQYGHGEADRIGTCWTCSQAREANERRKVAREARRTAANAAKGYGEPKPGEDVFSGFKGE